MSVEGGRELRVEVDVINEQVVLGAAIAGWDTLADKLLRTFSPDHFLSHEHAAIWTVFREMRLRKLGWDPATAKQLGGETFDVDLVQQITEGRPDVPMNLSFHIESMLWDRSRTTALQGPVMALLEALRDPKIDPERVHAIARQIPASLKSGDRKHLYDPGLLVRSQAAIMRARSDGVACYPFGLDGLDYYESKEAAKLAGIIDPDKVANMDGRIRRMLPGAEPGFVTLVSTATGNGKTQFACTLALSLARLKRHVLYCAWEPKAGLTLESLACQSLGWSRTRALQGQFTKKELAEHEDRMARISKYLRFMDKGAFFDFGGQKKKRTNEENLDIFAGYIADSGCDVVIADLWKYALVSQRPDDEEEALKYQQAMTEDLRFHLILLQQQTHKRMEMRFDKHPSREGVKGSGAYLEIADNYFAPHIPSLWKPGIAPDRFELFVLKQRYGRWPHGIEFDWDSDSGKIEGGRTIPYNQHEGGGDDGQRSAKGNPPHGHGQNVRPDGSSGASVSDDKGTDEIWTRGAKS
jgi:hypothetical protein